MQIDILLPCISFDVLVLPGDPNQLTDVEAAALFYIQHLNGLHEGAVRKVAEFVGLGDAVFVDMLITMVNRGWITIHSTTGQLIVTAKAERELARAQAGQSAVGIRSAEEGKRVTVCRDLVGGGFAVINPLYLQRAREHRLALPPSQQGQERETAPWGIPISGFADTTAGPDPSDEYRNEILKALKADSSIRKELFGGAFDGGHHVRILPPSQIPVWDDVLYYRCRFDVRAIQLAADLGDDPTENVGPAQDSPDSLELTCVEDRNPAIRLLGNANAEAIIDQLFQASFGPNADKRLLLELRAMASRGGAPAARTPDPLEKLQVQIRNLMVFPSSRDPDEVLHELSLNWKSAESRVERLVGAALAIEECGILTDAELDIALVERLKEKPARVLVSSPEIRLGSRHMSVQSDILTALQKLAISDSVGVLIHGLKSASRKGVSFAEEGAVRQLLNLLGNERVHLADDKSVHLRTPFVQIDDDTFIWQTEPLFGKERGANLMLRLSMPGGDSPLAAMARELPPELRVRWLALPDRRAQGAGAVVPWPPEVSASMRDLRGAFAGIAGLFEDTDRLPETLAEIDRQLSFLRSWVRHASNCFEPLAGAGIRDRSGALLGAFHDDEPLVIGIAGARDLLSFAEMAEEISQRLIRQGGGADVPLTAVCLPGGPSAKAAEMALRRYFPAGDARVRLLREDPGIAQPCSFVLSPTTAVIAVDGLVVHNRRDRRRQVGLQMLGPAARSLAVDFLLPFWPAAKDLFDARPRRTVTVQRQSAAVRMKELQFVASQPDGNMGATSVAAWLGQQQEPGSDLHVLAVSDLDDARQLLAADPFSPTGLALLKALACREHDSVIRDVGARALLAGRALEQQDLTVAAILADHLPEGAPLRSPLTRTLAYAVGRGTEPDLTGHDAALAQPDSTSLMLACLLMFEGRGGNLAGWLSELAPGQPLQDLARALALRQRDHDVGVIDLGPLAPAKDPLEIQDTLAQLSHLVEHALTRPDTTLVDQVTFLRERVFLKDDSFVVAFLRHVRMIPKGLERDAFGRALLEALRVSQVMLGVNLLGTMAAGQKAVKPARLARDYFDRKNREMARSENRDPVDIDKGGRNILTALERFFHLLIDDLLPAVNGIRDLADQALHDAARAYLATRESTDPIDGLLRARISRPVTTDSGAHFWRFPILQGRNDADWDSRKNAILRAEFAPDVGLAQVVRWFVAQDKAESASSGGLLLLYDLIERLSGQVDAEDLAKASRTLLVRLRERHDAALAELTVWKSLAALFDDSSALAQAASAADTAVGDLDVSIEAEDSVMALLSDDSLRRAMAALGAVGKAAIEAERDALSDQLRKAAVPQEVAAQLLSAHGRAETAEGLLRRRRTVRHAQALGQLLPFDRDLQLDIGDGRGPDGEGTGLLALFAVACRNAGGLPAYLGAQDTAAAAATVVGHFTDDPVNVATVTARHRGDHWVITAHAPLLSALTFVPGGSATFILPLGRDAEIRLGAPDGAAVPTVTQHGAIILLGLFASSTERALPVLPWRHVAWAGRLPRHQRRLAAMWTLAQQRFPTADARKLWWDDLTMEERVGLVGAALGLDQDATFDDAAMADNLRNICIALCLYVTHEGSGLRIIPAGLVAIEAAWPLDVGSHWTVHDLVAAVGRLVDSATLFRPPRSRW